MEILRGLPALSGFRTQALVRQAQQQALPLAEIETEYVHFVALNANLEADTRNTLIDLLDSPATGLTPAADSLLVLVTLALAPCLLGRLRLPTLRITAVCTKWHASNAAFVTT